MTEYGSGANESILMGFEATPGVMPGSATADKIPVTQVQIAPQVNRFRSKARTGVPRARSVVDGKIGANGSFTVEASREALNYPLKAYYGVPVANTGVVGWYDHYFIKQVAQPSFFIEDRFADTSPVLNVLWLGNKMASWSGQCDAEGLMEATFNLIGLSSQGQATTDYVTGTITDRTGSNPISYLPATIKEGGATLGYGTMLKWTDDRKLARKNAIDGTNKGLFIGPTDVPTISLSLTAFFPDLSLYQKAIASTETQVELLIPGVESGSGFKLIWPGGKYLPFGPQSQGQDSIMQNLQGDFYARGAATNVAGEARGKYLTSAVIVGATNDILKVKIDGAAAITITLTAGTRTIQQLATQIDTAITATGTCTVDFATYDSTGALTGGRLLVKSKALTGSLSSAQIDATGTAQTILGFDTVLHVGYDAVDMMVIAANADATIV